MSVGTVYDTAYKGDYNQVKVKLDANTALVNTPDPNGRLLIHWAALGGNHHLVEYLIDSGSPVDPVDDTNSTPLILGASAGRFEVVRLLIGKGANINHRTSRGQSALHYASSKGHLEIVKILIQSQVDVNVADVLGATPLHRAAAQGRSNITEQLLSCPDINVDLCDSTGSTPLHLACEEDRDAVATLLVRAGASMDIQNKEKKSPLDLASPKLRNMLQNVMSFKNV